MNRYQLAKEREKSRQLMDAFAIMADSVAMIAKVEVETPGDYGIGDLHEHEEVGGSGYSTPRSSDGDGHQRRHSPGEFGKSP